MKIYIHWIEVHFIFGYTLLKNCMRWLELLFILGQTILVFNITRNLRKHSPPPIYPISKEGVSQEDTSMDNNENRTFFSHDTSPTSEKGILVKEDEMVENH
jgi:hypothetical protein